MNYKKLTERLRHIYADGDPITEEAANAIDELFGIAEQLKAERDAAISALRTEETISFRRQMQEYAAQRDKLVAALEALLQNGADYTATRDQARAALASVKGGE